MQHRAASRGAALSAAIPLPILPCPPNEGIRPSLILNPSPRPPHCTLPTYLPTHGTCVAPASPPTHLRAWRRLHCATPVLPCLWALCPPPPFSATCCQPRLPLLPGNTNIVLCHHSPPTTTTTTYPLPPSFPASTESRAACCCAHAGFGVSHPSRPLWPPRLLLYTSPTAAVPADWRHAGVSTPAFVCVFVCMLPRFLPSPPFVCV